MAKDYNSKMQLPTSDNYVNRITFAEFVDSKTSGNPMIHFTSEIVSPEVVSINGEDVNIAGTTVEHYYTTTTIGDDEKTAANRKRILDDKNPDELGLYPRLGLDPASFNPENPDVSVFKGLVFLSAMGSKAEPQRKSPTAEQLAKGQKQGDIMKNPVTGKDMVFHKPYVKEIFGLAPSGVGSKATSNKPY